MKKFSDRASLLIAGVGVVVSVVAIYILIAAYSRIFVLQQENVDLKVHLESQIEAKLDELDGSDKDRPLIGV